MASANPFLIFFLFLSLSGIPSKAHNITEILAAYPDYSLHNTLLSETKLADDINTLQTITCLVLSNAAASSLSSNRSLSDLKASLSILILFDYLDFQKLHSLPEFSTFTTLFQTTGRAQENQGLVNVSNLGDKIGFGSASSGSSIDAFYVKSVKQIPFNISVIQISGPIISPDLLPASPLNISDLLLRSGCRIFSDLIVRSGVLTDFESAVDKGITVFAPLDQAFNASGVPDLRKLNGSDLVRGLKYHALPSYVPIASLRSEEGPVKTMAGYPLSVKADAGSVILSGGVGKSTVASTVADSAPVSIFAVDGVLLPAEMFGKSSPPAPSPKSSPGPAKPPSPSPVPKSSPGPAKPPSPSPVSGDVPSPPSPAAPEADSPDDGKDDQDSAAGDGTAATMLKTIAMGCVGWLLFALLI